MRWATGGTILACRLAFEHGVAVNLGGGFHHAAAGWGGGFCVYADLAARGDRPLREGRVEKVMVVDLDAHQGNGTAAVFAEWPWASILDVYQDDLFPSRKEPEDYRLPLRAGTTGGEYLDLLRDALSSALDAVGPDLVIYNAGSDPFIDDPLAGFRLTMSDSSERDLLVVSMVRERSIPVAMVLSGGYSTESWKIHADGIEGILTRFDTEMEGVPAARTFTDRGPPARRNGQTAVRPGAQAAKCYRAPASRNCRRSTCETRRRRD